MIKQTSREDLDIIVLFTHRRERGREWREGKR